MHADIGLSFLNTEDRKAIRPPSRRQPDAVGLETLETAAIRTQRRLPTLQCRVHIFAAGLETLGHGGESDAEAASGGGQPPAGGRWGASPASEELRAWRGGTREVHVYAYAGAA